MDKREIIERALDKIFWDSPRISVNAGRAATQILADQAIVIECEVEHSKFHTIVKNEIGNLPNRLVIDEHHGTPGKAIAIIVSLGEE